MGSSSVTGIIDIGSNTVRLGVYQLTEGGAHRVIDQGRFAARLSQRLTPEGLLPEEAVEELVEVLRHYRQICLKHGATRIRAVATAAIRQAANRDNLLRYLKAATGVEVELLSGDEEARIGSEAMTRTMNVQDGFVVDIGGGSTELSLLRDGRLVSSVSFPIGCVNTAGRHALGDDPVPLTKLQDMQEEMRALLQRHSWTTQHPGLALIGLGGTVRALAKLRQRESDYPFPLLHGYEMSDSEVEDSLHKLADIPVDKRRKLPGLSKDRGDVIVPGLALLLAVIREIGSTRLIVCGAGLRDGLFLETCVPRSRRETDETAAAGERVNQVLEESIRNLTALYPTAPEEHLSQVSRLAVTMFDVLAPDREIPSDMRLLLASAARLFRIGAVIDFNNCADHTFYMLVHTHWNGMSHREILLTAAIASYRGTNSLRRQLSPYRSILSEGDMEAVSKLGALLQLASALDRSESQAIRSLEMVILSGKLLLAALADHPLPVERLEVESLGKDFRKAWD
ncbi:Ppx/GppA phosphatase family protein [Cohnella faecalis]|uniref:Ppx/GppA family phosphatase n=1 Tax=Cohnella faecalis TaxID=2315694 RepID=A0A398CSU7_9BACL|nr:Ppx/GppA phosphatase family protein [Cohnella faecalis]RIE02887.1 Ppx/GppA family phosphatase [Cohnella faecalis]